MPVSLTVPISAPIRLKELVQRAAPICSRLLGMETVPNILPETYGDAATPLFDKTALFGDGGESIQFHLESTDGVAFAMGFESLALSGTALVITPGRAPLGAALGAALAIAGAELANSRIIDHALHFTACA